MIHKNTKIVCTIGPASEKPEIIEKLILSGMNVARLNFSHGKYEEYVKTINTIRKVSHKLKIPVAIMQDLQGPKIRVGEMPEKGIMLKKDTVITLTAKKIKGKEDASGITIPFQYKHLPKDVKKDDRILLCDGMLELQVIKVKGEEITCKVLSGGLLESHKGINVPTASISANPITDKDKKDLAFGLSHDVDYVALSFVKNAKNIEELREMIRQHRGEAKIIAKIERHEAIQNMEEIIIAADGVMVARGDMGVEIPAEQVPIVQKKLIRMANRHGKPVITATEMMQSMIDKPRPTRAEVSDVANAIFDNTDAIMLSNESAVGKYPVKATLTLSKIAHAIENEMKNHTQFLPGRLFHEKQPISYGTCEAAAEMARNIGAKMIVIITMSGFTAQHIAKHRPYIPMIVITEDPKVQLQLQLVWGINQVFVRKINFQDYIPQIRKLLREKKLVNKHDQVVVICNASHDEKLISTIII
jgi:pyruvate kinase